MSGGIKRNIDSIWQYNKSAFDKGDRIWHIGFHLPYPYEIYFSSYENVCTPGQT